ncbi:MAG: flavodoxin family protein [Candidatus Bipolaricaulota bacterium]
MPDAVRVLGVVGSPREGGNTDTLVSTVLEAAESLGAKTSKLFVDRYAIAPCRSCGACVPTGRCIYRDGMDELLSALGEHDVWVLGTPVYWWGPTAQLKTFVDRWFAPWANAETRKLFRGRVAVTVVALGDSHAAVARHTVGMFSDVFTFLGIPVVGTVVAPGVGGSGIAAGADVLRRPEILDAAREAGRAAVERVRSP